VAEHVQDRASEAAFERVYVEGLAEIDGRSLVHDLVAARRYET
jgi:hypothetical protein